MIQSGTETATQARSLRSNLSSKPGLQDATETLSIECPVNYWSKAESGVFVWSQSWGILKWGLIHCVRRLVWDCCMHGRTGSHCVPSRVGTGACWTTPSFCESMLMAQWIWQWWVLCCMLLHSMQCILHPDQWSGWFAFYQLVCWHIHSVALYANDIFISPIWEKKWDDHRLSHFSRMGLLKMPFAFSGYDYLQY